MSITLDELMMNFRNEFQDEEWYMKYWQDRITVMQHALKFKGSTMTPAGRELLRKDISRSKQQASRFSGKPKLSYRKRRAVAPR